MSEKEINLTISKNLLKYLELKNRSQAELAEYVGVTQATVSNWCNGIKMPRMSKIDMICEFLGINRSDLMNDQSQDPQYYLNPETARMAQKFFDDPNYRLLFDAAEDIKPEDLQMFAEMMKRFKATNPDG